MEIIMMSPDLPEETGNLQIPEDEIRRQAVNSLRGYIYQIYQTLNAWLTLKEDEILLLEVAEDFAIVTKDALKGIQVKDTALSGSVTLKTISVSKTIKSLWEFQLANPDKHVTITYLTTSKIGKEKELTFPDDQCGLTYWHIAARESTDVEPIRNALLSLDLPKDILTFIKNATPEELKNQILRRIDWVCGAGDIDEISQVIADRLVYLGERQNLTPSDSERSQDSLIVAILKKIVQEDNRKLSRVDFLRIFEKAVSVSIPISQMREHMRDALNTNGSSGVSISAVDLVLNAIRIPLPPRVLDRRSLVEKLILDTGQSGSLWLFGSSGTGKTILAQLIARHSKYDWLFIQLRNCSPSEIEFRLCRILQTLQSGKIGGVILDDFPTKHAHNVHLRLTMLVSEVHRIYGSIIITSSKSPSSTMQECFGMNGPTVVNLPYLSREEVAELVKLAGGDAEKWAGTIHSFCGFGHPQLVQARIIGLQQRNWPKGELLAGLPGFISANEIEEERDSVRERLFSELSKNIRELLYRLTIIVGYFDRKLAIAIGEVEPAISRPGEALDILLGPWIEVLANDCFRISPLVSNAGSQTLSKRLQLEVHKRIVDHLIIRHPFPGSFLGTLLSHALLSRHEKGLTWLSIAIMYTRGKDKGRISEQLFLLPLLDTKQPLFKENIHVSVMLRLAQFRVATWANNIEHLPAIANQLITEVKMIDRKEISESFTTIVIITILIEPSLKMSPKKWIPLLIELEQTFSSGGELAQSIRTFNNSRKNLEDWTTTQFLFVLRATSLKSINELSELFAELNHLECEHREMLTSSLNELPSGKRIMIDSAWLAEVKEGTLRGVEAAEKYRELAEIAAKWGNTDIAVECEYARAVMLDEYANDSNSALASLDEAEKKYPNQIRLIRQRASIYYRRGDHSTALSIISQITNVIPKEDYIDRAFALREAGISAAETGDFGKASRFFFDACEAASAATNNMRPMAIGLKGDQAIAQFKLGNKSETLNLMRSAITDAEQLNPKAGKKEKYCILILGHAILWMQKQVEYKLMDKIDVQIVPGCCSKPEPSEEIMERPSLPSLFLWYQLTFLEVMMGINAGILDELRKRTCTKRIISCEVALSHYLIVKYITTVDIENFFSYLAEYTSKTAYMEENRSSINEKNIYEIMNIDSFAIKPVDWTSNIHLRITKDAIIATVASAFFSKSIDIRGQILNYASQNKESKIALCNFLNCFEKQTQSKDDAFEIIASHIGNLMNTKAHISPDDSFIVTYRLWEWLSSTYFKYILEDVIANYLSQHWKKIIEHQKFLLKQPMTAVPAIDTVIGDSTKGTIRIAKLLLAAEVAVNHNLSANLRSKLQDHCLNK
jgi:tetratricopeptide (TPR) repeat protein